MRMMEVIDKNAGKLPAGCGVIPWRRVTPLCRESGSSIGSTATVWNHPCTGDGTAGIQEADEAWADMGARAGHHDPPSGFAVMLAILGNIDLGKLLLAIVMPGGLLMAVLYAAYIIIRCMLQPSLAPPYDVEPLPFLEKLLVPQIRPALASIIIVALGLIFLGVATPSESASLGALFTFFLAIAYRSSTGRSSGSFCPRDNGKSPGMVMMIVTGRPPSARSWPSRAPARAWSTSPLGFPLPPP